MSREQILRTTEEKFCTAHLDEYHRASSVLVGLTRTLVIYDRENPDHNPAVPIRDNATDISTVVLPKSLAKILRHKDQQDLMDAGGWMDIHTVCYVLHIKYDYEGISVNRLVALARSTQGERYEIAVCKFDPDDRSALAALDDRTDTLHVDPLRSHPVRDLILVGARINL